jgi:hypothetical protein
VVAMIRSGTLEEAKFVTCQLLNRRQGHLVYNRDRRSGRWIFNSLLSTVDGLPKNM